MSRLDSVIRRLQAQRACLDKAAALIAALPGPIFELGLGQGRTYDHLRRICPEREIFVFEREVAAGAECAPDCERLILGDIRDTLAAAPRRFARAVPLVHSDIGTGDADLNAELAAGIAEYLPALLCPGGIVVSDQDLAFPGTAPIELPEGVRTGRYHIYRVE